MVRKKRKKQSGLVRIIGTVVFVLLILGLLGGYFLIQRYSYGTERADISDWFEAGDASSFPMIINGVNVEKKARSFDGAYYLSLEDVHEYVSTRFYYGEADQIFVYSTPDAVITNPVGTGEYTSTVAGSNTMEHAISRTEGDTLYVLIDYLKLYYDISFEAYTEPNRMTVHIDTWQAETAQVNHDTWLRHRGGIKSDILIDLKEEDRVIILEDEDEDWIKVRSEDGFAGYVEKKRLGEHTTYTNGADTLQEPVYTSITKPYRISI
ncbi:MAG: SH3 domain-containing protein, partial [Butyrivibrio sp.]|nr:SH3 domain-containing protein [Butyrivibrio sp.]